MNTLVDMISGMLEQIYRKKVSFNPKTSGLLLSDSVDTLRTLLERSQTHKRDHFLLHDGYEHFYFLTNDSYGEALLQMLCLPEIVEQVNAILRQELQPPSSGSHFEHDALTDSGAPVLFSYLPDIPRLFRFISAINFLKYSGIIVCFDFQADALRPLCGDSIELQIINFREFQETFNL